MTTTAGQAPETDPIDLSDLSDEELTAIALAADPDMPLAADATPWMPERTSTLPASYLPAASRRSRPGSRIRTMTVLVVIAAFLAITGLGFCATYGQLVFA